MSQPLIDAGRREAHRQLFFLRDRADDIVDRLEHALDRERHRIGLHEELAVREIDDVTGHRAELERSSIDETELAPLDLIHAAALTRCSVSARKRIDVSGERRSCATFTSNPIPPG